MLEDLLRWLVRRPPRGERMLPMVGLCGDVTNVEACLEMFGAALAGAVHVAVDVDALDPLPEGSSLVEDTTPGLTALRRLLYNLCKGLSADRFGRLRPLPFRRYRLAEWLMARKLSSDNELDELASLLRRDFGRWGEELLGEAEATVGVVQRFALGLLRIVLPTAVFRARTGGRIPGVGREFRWFMRQQYLAPEQSSQFVGFAHRLTEGARRHEHAEHLAKLLVHAFLEDLRVAYHRRWWGIGAARRTTYPVVILRALDGEAGQRLLDLINDVRNETGKDDPLLVVAGTRTPPPGVTARPAYRVRRLYEIWVDELPVARQRQRPRAWQLWFAVPATGPNDDEPDPFRRIRPPAPPWWARRALSATAVFLVVVLAVAAAGFATWRPWRAGTTACGTSVADRWVRVVSVADGNCVGFSAYDPDDPAAGGRGFLFASDEPGSRRLVEVQRRVYKQNLLAEQLAARQPTRPLFTLVYFGQLTGVPGDYPAQSEDIEGLALAQYSALESVAPDDAVTPDTVPLIRLLLANTGPANLQGPQVVELLTPLIRAEPGVVGAIGLDQSRTATLSMINALTGLGLPMVAPSLSADEMVRSSPLYFQIAPPNHAIADMIEQYLNSVPGLAGRGVRIYHRPDPTDLYTENMAEDLHILGRSGRDIWEGSWDLREAFAAQGHGDACDEVLFFAGRDSEFPDFLQSLNKACGDKRVLLIADDSVNRFMASADRRRAANSARPLVYVAKASLVTCRNKGQGLRSRVEFYNLATTVDPDIPSWNACAETDKPLGERVQLHPLGERVALTYDAVGLFVRAVQALAPTASGVWTEPIPISAAAVWAALRDLPRQPVIESSSGVLDFSVSEGAHVGRVAHEKWVGLLSVDQIWDPSADTEPVMIYGCGRATANDDPRCRPYPLGGG
ncbi:hypothetical protein [Nocardia implantans]|uniref:ABC transporter substrate-binding protein n=1 Tax=Nocardia implantans TaxID=3108168 RepID=A0ABU6AYY7_9NOCA|nr:MULTISPECIES: hypothetical protein [unclassified Nocardia]MBF6194201.1 hypothetical protein [Nocardia beijingensis]MEA3529809.1 hypothetical protein [Nocardia sp. CDC192]MEB3512713.1 hypothetical protein [Nocardia sp. CDC186]